MSRLTVLDLFIVESIKRGACTAYDLQRRAGISLGASSPALKRLAGSGIVTRIPVHRTPRRRYEFKVTREGMRQFRRSWREYLLSENSVDDIDSVLRILDLAFHNGAPHNAIGEFLDRVIDSRRTLAKRLAVAMNGHKAVPQDYRILRERFDSKRHLFEANALAEFRRSLLNETGKQPARPSRPRH